MSYQIAGKTLQSRLLTGTGKFQSASLMQQSLAESGTELVTMALRRVDLVARQDEILPVLTELGVQLLPNTSGARSAEEALYVAELAREALQTNWLKLEIHPDPRYLLPDPIETLKAAQLLVSKGFVVLPYCGADPVLCKRLEEAGCAAVMPLGAPIGSNQGLLTRDFLRIIIEQSRVPVIVDAGIGAPSHALEALELGATAVLVNTAIASATDPISMARAFKLACEAGVLAQQAGLAARQQQATASSPLTAFLETL